MSRNLLLLALAATLLLPACESASRATTPGERGIASFALNAPEGLLPDGTFVRATITEGTCAEPLGVVAFEETAAIDPTMRMVEFSAVLPVGDHCLTTTLEDQDGQPVDVCAAADREPFTVVPNGHLMLTMEFVCAPDDGLVVIGVDFVVGGVTIDDIDCDRFWDHTLPEVVVCQVEATGEGTLDYAFELFHRPPADPGEYTELLDLGGGAFLFASKTASPDHVVLVQVADEAGGVAYVTVPIDLALSPDAAAVALPFDAPTPVDLADPSATDRHDQYDVGGVPVPAPDEEFGLVLTGCGAPVTLSSSDPAFALVVVPDTDIVGAAPSEALAYKPSGDAEVTFDTEAGAHYVVYVERFGFGTTTDVLATGCP